ncbi:MAG TPA: hypothetical protein VGB78_02765 [Thermoplasmata archaeon]
MQEESKYGEISHVRYTKRVFGVVLKGEPEDFQRWLDSAKNYDLYVVFSKSSRTGKLILKEECW